MKTIKLRYLFFFLAFFLTSTVQAAMKAANYYISIAGANSKSEFPQGEFIDGMAFESSIAVNIQGNTEYVVLFAHDCNNHTVQTWERYFIIPESVEDTTGQLTIHLASSENRSLIGTKDGINQYGYLSDYPLGTAVCLVGSTVNSEVTSVKREISFQSSITKNTAKIASGLYTFNVPVRIVASVIGTEKIFWTKAALEYPPTTMVNININISNFCNFSQIRYDFDFGSLTEAAINETDFFKKSETKDLNINCMLPANIELSVITDNSINNEPNKVKMGSNLFSEFYINDKLQDKTIYTNTSNINVPLHAILRRINSVNTIEAGQYTGASVLKIKIE